jgi:Protein of unknown function (DUF1631)
MVKTSKSFRLSNYIDDELQLAPLVWDQLIDTVLEQALRKQSAKPQRMRSDEDDLPQLLHHNRSLMGQAYVDSLCTQTRRALQSTPKQPAKPDAERGRGKKMVLELVGLDSIALDVKLSGVIQAIKDEAEHELRDLQAFLAAVVGDMDIEEDHNPLHPAVHGRALRAAAQAMRATLQQQLAFVHQATPPFAQLLRQGYGASCTRLEESGVEPASHRCIVMPDGKRRLQVLPDVAYVPELPRARRTPPASPRGASLRERLGPLTREPRRSEAAARPPHDLLRASIFDAGPTGREPAPTLAGRGATDRQVVDLVNRLFNAFPLDERVPDDVREIIAQLRAPAMRLALRDPSLLDQREHPIWRLIHLFAYQAEMLPKSNHAERLGWLHYGRKAIEELAVAPLQKAASYQAAFERMEEFLRQRLVQRCAALTARFQALQTTEVGLAATSAEASDNGKALNSTLAALLPRVPRARLTSEEAQLAADAWFNGLVPGQWLRLQLKGAWVHAQLLWQGERRQIVMLGDGATETTWALRRGVLLKLHRHGLAKTLQMRSLVGTAAMRVQEQFAIGDAA